MASFNPAAFQKALQGVTLQQLLAADSAGHTIHKAFEYSNYALAVATPVGIVAKTGGFISRTNDLVLGFAIPVHMHVSMNAVVSDYLPNAAKGPVRAGLLGATALTTLGLLRLNLFGPGITACVKGLWAGKPKEAPKAAAAKK